jgi:hypothetical protein
VAPLDELNELLEGARPVLARPELRMEGPAMRARLRAFGQGSRLEPGWLLTWPGEVGTESPELRPWRLGDGPPDLEISGSAEDLVRHLRGELDLLCSRLPRVRLAKQAGPRAIEDLIPVGKRMLALLALACQTDERFAGSTAEELYLTHRSQREDGAYEPMGDWSLPFGAGKLLYELVRDEGLDGLHVLDYVVLDLFYCDLLLAEGGYMVFDDASLSAVGAALDFLETSRGESYQRIEALSGDRLAVYRKTGPDQRIERHGVVFHRPFRGDGPAFPSHPPAARPRLLKRAFDLAVGVPLSMLAAGPALVLAGAIALEDARSGRGARSPLERVPRVSRGRSFDLLSFRSRDHDGRPTPVGAAIERLRLTRLPQLWNLLRGDLTTPIRPEENVRRQLFETTGLRAGLVGPQDLADRSGDVYYHDWSRLGAPALLAHDLGLLLRVAVSKLRAAASPG